jgi:hypothetical protein
MEELVEEVLLHLPPEDPASLVRKLWCRLVCGAAFCRRFLEFHRSAPHLLGVLYRKDVVTDTDTSPLRRMPTAYFVPTTSFLPARAAAGRGQYGWCAIDARHGRVLLWRSSPSSYGRADLSVWDPVTDEQRDLPEPPLYLHGYYRMWNAAAAAAGGDCDHLDCRQGPFLVVVIDIKPHNMYLSIYSSNLRLPRGAT